MQICLFYVLTKTKRFEIVIKGLETKLIKLNQITKKNNLKIFLLRGPHLHAHGPQIFFSGPHFIQINCVFAVRRFSLRGPQFADPVLIQTKFFLKVFHLFRSLHFLTR